MIDLFIIGNDGNHWKMGNSLHKCPDLADRLDIATGCKHVQDGQRVKNQQA